MPARFLRTLSFIPLFLLAACSGLAPAVLPQPISAAVLVPTHPAALPTVTWTALPALTNTPTRVYPSSTPSPTPTNTPTSTPIFTRTPTPDPLPAFVSANLYPNIVPVSYLGTCTYLLNRWDDSRAAPGTVVVPIMYHQVVASEAEMRSPNQVTRADFITGLDYAHRLGFQTITTAQLADFLETNAYIPKRSLVLIIDDLESPALRSQYVDALADYGFYATWAYITGQKDAYEWQQVDSILAAGRFELQPHGFLHNDFTYIHPETPEETLIQEIFNPLEVIRAHTGKDAVAFIWPGGDYTPHSVDLAAQAGYRIGFTVRNRGPILFNWIPQGDDERAVAYPLLVLPRAWSREVPFSLDRALAVSAEAEAFAYAHREDEVHWYQANCKTG